jgi:very-short-patch-repair endonuclease
VRSAPSGGAQSAHAVKVLGVRDPIVVTGTRDERIAAIADAQRGRVSRAQLTAAGITDSAIRTRTAKSWLHRLHIAVYAVGHRAPIGLGAETAALLAVGDGAVLSHQTAVVIWRLIPVGFAPAQIHLTVVGRDSAKPAGIVVHRTRRLHRRDLRIEQRLPLTSPARTILDLADVLPIGELEKILDEGIASKIVRLTQVEEVLARSGQGRHGAPALQSLVDERRSGKATGRTRSEGERRFFELLRAAQLPLPEKNAPIHGFTADFLWRDEGVVVEFDSYQFHSTKSAFERDHRKDAVFKANHLDVTRITWEQMEDEPYAIVARLAKTLTERTCAGAGSSLRSSTSTPAGRAAAARSGTLRSSAAARR